MTSKQVVAARTIRRVRTAGSITDQIDQLEVGKSLSTTERFPLDDGKDHGEEIKAALARMRATTGSYVNRVQSDGLDMRTYRVESGAYLTDDRAAILVTVAVTRLE